MQLTTVLPAAVFGPALAVSALSSLQLIAALLDGSAIALPHLGFEVVDVRDVAAAHLLAMTSPQAAGERFIVSVDLLWFADVAEVLRAHLGWRRCSRCPDVTCSIHRRKPNRFSAGSIDPRSRRHRCRTVPRIVCGAR